MGWEEIRQRVPVRCSTRMLLRCASTFRTPITLSATTRLMSPRRRTTATTSLLLCTAETSWGPSSTPRRATCSGLMCIGVSSRSVPDDPSRPAGPAPRGRWPRRRRRGSMTRATSVIPSTRSGSSTRSKPTNSSSWTFGRRSMDDRLIFEALEEIASEAFMPLGYGGGVRSLQTATDLIQKGVEKVVVNALTVEDPDEVRRMSDYLGELDHRRRHRCRRPGSRPTRGGDAMRHGQDRNRRPFTCRGSGGDGRGRAIPECGSSRWNHGRLRHRAPAFGQ